MIRKGDNRICGGDTRGKVDIKAGLYVVKYGPLRNNGGRRMPCNCISASAREVEIEMRKSTLRKPSRVPAMYAGKELKWKEQQQNELVYWGSGF